MKFVPYYDHCCGSLFDAADVHSFDDSLLWKVKQRSPTIPDSNNGNWYHIRVLEYVLKSLVDSCRESGTQKISLLSRKGSSTSDAQIICLDASYDKIAYL